MLCQIFAVVLAHNSHGDLLLGVIAWCKTCGMLLFLIFLLSYILG